MTEAEPAVEEVADDETSLPAPESFEAAPETELAAGQVERAVEPIAQEPIAGVEYIGSGQCKACHNKKSEGQQWNKWKAMKHAKAYEALLTEAAAEVAAKVGVAGPPAEAPECLRCHTTALDVLAKEDGVQCESCHGPGSLHKEAGKKVMFSKDSDVDPKVFLLKANEQTCIRCHNERNPTWDSGKYALAGGQTTGFDYEQASRMIAHPRSTP